MRKRTKEIRFDEKNTPEDWEIDVKRFDLMLEFVPEKEKESMMDAFVNIVNHETLAYEKKPKMIHAIILPYLQDKKNINRVGLRKAIKICKKLDPTHKMLKMLK